MRNLLMAMLAVALLASAPAAEAQYRPNPPEGWTGLALRNAQNVPTALFANMDMALCESSAIHGRGAYSESCGRLARRYQTGQIDRLYSDAARARFFSGTPVFEPGYYASGAGYGYGGTGYGGYYPSSYGYPSYGTPPINGRAGFPDYGGYGDRYARPRYGGYGIGAYDDFMGYGPGFLDYFDSRWTYHTRRGRHHLATQNNVNAWGIANTAIGAGHLIYDIIQTRNQNRRLDEINRALEQLEYERRQPQMVPVAQASVVPMAPVAAPQAAPQTQGAAVVNNTGCDLLLREKSGRLTRVQAGRSAYVLDPSGLGAKTLDGSACAFNHQMTSDGSAVVITCN